MVKSSLGRRTKRALLGLSLLFVAGPLAAGHLAYSFRDGDAGGVALLKVDIKSGAIEEHETLFVDSRAPRAKKVRYSTNAKRVALTNETVEHPFMIMSRSSSPSPVKPVPLPEPCDEARAWANFFIVSCKKGIVALVTDRSGKVHRTWNGREALSPSGHRPEDIFIPLHGTTAIVSFQKDSKSGKHRGNRLVLLDLPKLKLLADLQLPRNHPELHAPGNPKLQGPCPEALLVSAEHDTILVTLDLYGGVAMMDLTKAKKGKLGNLVYLSTALDGSWGKSFPDRVSLLPIQDRRYGLVVNAGKPGGTVLVDLSARTIAKRWRTPTGLEAPVFLTAKNWAISVRSGKTKLRQGDSILKEYHPGTELFVFELGDDPAQGRLRTMDIGLSTFAVAPVDPEDCDLVVVFAGKEKADRILVVDTTDGRILTNEAAHGIAQRVERR